MVVSDYTYDEIRSVYAFKANEAQALCMSAFDDYLDQLEKRGLVVSCSDYVGVNALYGMLRGLSVVPVEEPFITKVYAFLHLTFIKKVPFKDTKKIFAHGRLSGVEKTVMRAVRQSMLTTSELVQYITAADTASNGMAYKDEMSDGGSTVVFNQPLPEQHPVLEAVADLYLKKLILFESVR